jgi:hypothetical protein
MVMDHFIKNKLIDFYYNESNINDFEKWVYENDSIEQEYEKLYTLLISINYKDKEDVNSGKIKLKELDLLRK